MKKLRSIPLRRQRGATLVMGIVFLTLLMLSVTIAFRMSNNNLKAVGNMQAQSEAEASAERAIEQVISTDTLFLAPAPTNLAKDEYDVAVSVAAPQCIRSVAIEANTSPDSNPNIYIQNLPPGSNSGYVETHWNIAAEATGASTGARVVVNQGVRLVMQADPNPCP
jgi:Tfp pilus assembly protein PilX